MVPKRMTARQARDNFTDLIGMVYYGKEPVIVERKGRPFAVVISPDEYERYKKVAKEQFFKTAEQIQKRNIRFSEKKVSDNVTRVVEKVRQTMYDNNQ
jgi:prevent-host-death family protein